eukprot:10392835-Alexandrium_andersonii.AAC.1
MKPKSQCKHLWTALPGQSVVRPRHDARGGVLGRRERQKKVRDELRARRPALVLFHDYGKCPER